MASSIFYSQNLAAGQYVNWGITSGDLGYGLRDNAGTIEFKDTGGSWAPISSSSSGGGWQRVGTVVSLVTGTDTLGSNLRPTDATYTLGDASHRWNGYNGAGDFIITNGTTVDITTGPMYFDVTETATTGSYTSAININGRISNTADDAATIMNGIYLDAYLSADHTMNFLSGQDFTNYVTVATGKTVATYNARLFDIAMDGAGTITAMSALSIDPGSFTVDATQITTGSFISLGAPALSNGAAIGTWYYLKAEDLSGLTVGTAKGFINYGAGKFVVDSAGTVTANNYKSSDGSAGADTTITTATLVGKTITVKDGLIVSFA